MTGIVQAFDHEQAERQKIVARCKTAPMIAPITAASALAAYRNFQKYRSLSEGAYTKYMQAGIGTQTQRKHHTRYLAYADVAEGWERVFESWLLNEARVESAA